MYSQNVIKKIILEEDDVENENQHRLHIPEDLLITLRVLYGDDFVNKLKNKSIKIPHCPLSLCAEYDDLLSTHFENTFIKNTFIDYSADELDYFLQHQNQKQVIQATNQLQKKENNGSAITKMVALYIGYKTINTETKFYNESASKAFGFDFNVDDYTKKPVFKYKPNKQTNGYKDFFDNAEEWADYNVNLIKNVKKQTANDIKKIVVSGYKEGARSVDLIDDILETTQYSRNRVKRIARDQVSKLYGQKNKAHSLALGLNKYRWRTCLDERVRESHQEKEGQVYLFDAGVNPGEEVNCRCVADSLLEWD